MSKITPAAAQRCKQHPPADQLSQHWAALKTQKASPMNNRRANMQRTLLVVAHAVHFAPLHPPALEPKPLIPEPAGPLPQEVMQQADPDYHNQSGPFWYALHG